MAAAGISLGQGKGILHSMDTVGKEAMGLRCSLKKEGGGRDLTKLALQPLPSEGGQ